MTTRTGNIIWTATLFIAAGATTLAADAPTAAAPAASGLPSMPALKQDQYTDGVAATVNGQIITMTELDKEMHKSIKDLFDEVDAKYPPTPEGAAAAKAEFVKRGDDLGREFLHSMVDRILIVNDFHARGYSYPQYYLDWQFEDRLTTQFHGDHEEYLRYLQTNDMTESDFRKQLEDQDIVEAMIQQQRGTGTGISPDRIKAYYEKNKQDFYVKESSKVRQITLNLRPVADVTPELILQQAAKIVQDARQPGANFSELARRYSTDGSARSGDAPIYTYYRDDKNALPPKVQDAVFKLQPGEVSDPVVNDNLIFIFKCEDRTAEGYLPLEKVRTAIEKTLVDQDEQQATEKWLEKLRSKAFIQYRIYGPETASK